MTRTALEQKPLADILLERDISTAELARMAGIHANVTRRAVKPSRLKMHVTCAMAIAQALELEVAEIQWLNGLSETGRHCHTGTPIGVVNNSSNPTPEICPIHFTALPATKVCDDCNY